jgi:hypothetical protein
MRDGEQLGFTDGEFVFAFRVRKVRIHESGRVEQDDYNRDALLGVDDDEGEEEELAFEVDGLEDVDEAGEEFQLGGETVTEGEEEIRVYAG